MANDNLIDHNKVNTIIMIQYFLKTMNLVLIIMNFSYFFGSLWYIMCTLIDEYYMHKNLFEFVDGHDIIEVLHADRAML